MKNFKSWLRKNYKNISLTGVTQQGLPVLSRNGTDLEFGGYEYNDLLDDYMHAQGVIF